MDLWGPFLTGQVSESRDSLFIGQLLPTDRNNTVVITAVNFPFFTTTVNTVQLRNYNRARKYYNRVKAVQQYKNHASLPNVTSSHYLLIASDISLPI